MRGCFGGKRFKNSQLGFRESQFNSLPTSRKPRQRRPPVSNPQIYCTFAYEEWNAPALLPSCALPCFRAGRISLGTPPCDKSLLFHICIYVFRLFYLEERKKVFFYNRKTSLCSREVRKEKECKK